MSEQEKQAQDGMQAQENVAVQIVKGPDPAVWGERDAQVLAEGGNIPLGIGETRELEDGTLLKGPSEQWAQDADGNYVNR